MTRQVPQHLLDALKKINRPEPFCTSGCLPPLLPGLEVVGLGAVALPLGKRNAAALKKRARQAPYGKGIQTLVDTDVRPVTSGFRLALVYNLTLEKSKRNIAAPTSREHIAAAVPCCASGAARPLIQAKTQRRQSWRCSSIISARRQG